MMGNFGLAAVGSAGPVPTLLLDRITECYVFSIIINVNLFLYAEIYNKTFNI